MFGKLAKEFHKKTFKPQVIGADITPADLFGFQFKEYPRFKQVPLPKPESFKKDFVSILHSRRSTRTYSSEKKITLAELSTTLYFGAGMRGKLDEKGNPTDPGRFYPSGGSRNPLETYIIAKQADDLTPGVYHYNILRHSLEYLAPLPETQDLNEALLYPWSHAAPVLLVISSIWDRVVPKYQDFGYQIALIEAGHLAQNLILTSVALGISSCPFVGFTKEKINEFLDLHYDDRESAIYMLSMGA